MTDAKYLYLAALLLVMTSLASGCVTEGRQEHAEKVRIPEYFESSAPSDRPLFSVDPKLVYTDEQLKGTVFDRTKTNDYCNCGNSYDKGFIDGQESYKEGYSIID